MKQAVLVVASAYQNNRIFDESNARLNRDNCLSPFRMLKEGLERKGYALNTQDLVSIEEADIVLYNEMPSTLPDDKEKSYLMLFESELIRPDNWDLEKHKAFKKIFTWHDGFVDGERYIKFNFSQDIVQVFNSDTDHRQKLVTLIAGNKKNTHPLELYSKRLEVINWFEKYKPEAFEFYGMGWDAPAISNRYLRFAINKISFIKKLLAPKFSTYRGKVDSKLETLKQYRFAICFENARDIPGYITEKIFDCLFSGCIPVYWGADNISKYVPKNCYIEFTHFESMEELVNYIETMTDTDYTHFQKSIETYLKSIQIEQFSSKEFARVITEKIA